MKDYPSIKYLKECFYYDSQLGDLVWKVRPLSHFKDRAIMNRFNGRLAGKAAGGVWKNKYGAKYLTTNINDSNYQIHRIIWKLIYGTEPVHIDHINGNGVDNRLENLRSVTQTENSKNQKIGGRNKSGVIGVLWVSEYKKWKAQIVANGKAISIGHYTSKWDAICARKSAEYRFNFHENHGRR